jgi:hypothetical protein
MMTPDLTEEDIRVLQYVADRGDAGITTDRAVLRYRALAKAGLLEHRAVSLDVICPSLRGPDSNFNWRKSAGAGHICSRDGADLSQWIPRHHHPRQGLSRSQI